MVVMDGGALAAIEPCLDPLGDGIAASVIEFFWVLRRDRGAMGEPFCGFWSRDAVREWGVEGLPESTGEASLPGETGKGGRGLPPLMDEERLGKSC